MAKPNFPLIADNCILSIPIQENGEPLVDLKTMPGNIEISPRYYANNPNCSKVRQSVAEKLLQASENLPKGLKFLIIEGYRPLSIQIAIYHSYYHKLAKANPQWPEDKIREEASQYVAPPDIVPPHSTGGAFDITLIDQSGNPLDMGGDTEDKPHENDFKNYTFASNISPEEESNRQILIEILENEGFINYPAEWWHWSYGDRYWAYHAGYPQALYDSV